MSTGLVLLALGGMFTLGFLVGSFAVGLALRADFIELDHARRQLEAILEDARKVQR